MSNNATKTIRINPAKDEETLGRAKTRMWLWKFLIREGKMKKGRGRMEGRERRDYPSRALAWRAQLNP
jgi:hypothetical protein